MADQLADFLEGNAPKAWLIVEGLEIYVRRGQRIVDTTRFMPNVEWRALKRVKTFEIANIKTAFGFAPGQGHFKRYLPVLSKQVQDTGMFDGLFFETVQLLRLQVFLRGQRFEVVTIDDYGQADMYRPFTT